MHCSPLTDRARRSYGTGTGSVFTRRHLVACRGRRRLTVARPSPPHGTQIHFFLGGREVEQLNSTHFLAGRGQQLNSTVDFFGGTRGGTLTHLNLLYRTISLANNLPSSTPVQYCAERESIVDIVTFFLIVAEIFIGVVMFRLNHCSRHRHEAPFCYRCWSNHRFVFIQKSASLAT